MLGWGRRQEGGGKKEGEWEVEGKKISEFLLKPSKFSS